MEQDGFEQFLKDKNNKLFHKSDQEKIRIFINWCQKRGNEELILRLASENKGGWGNNYKLDFTTNRIIVKKKSFFKKFGDYGYTAGLAPYPYLILDKKRKIADIKVKTNIDSSYIYGENSSFFIMYNEIKEFVLKKGIDSMVMNMMGRAIVSNYIKIKTNDNTFDFTMPVNKNGKFEDVRRWLETVLPFEILIK